MTRRLVGLVFAVLLAAHAAQAQITCVGGGCGRPFTDQIQVVAGTAALPAVTFISDAGFNTGLYWGQENEMAFSSGGAITWRTGSNYFHFGNGALNFASAVGGAADVVIQRGGAPGAIRISGGTTPTQSGTTCGTGATIAGNNRRGCVTIGTAPSTCVIVFNGTWTNAPSVWLSPEVLTTGTTTVRSTSVSTTQFTITPTAALVATDKVCWLAESN